MSEHEELTLTLDHFFAEGWITDILHVVKSGKEATVYCCQADPSRGVELFAAKLYRPRQDRSFKNDAVYQEGRVIVDKRLRRAFANKSRRGRELQFSSWVAHEFETAEILYNAGAIIPKPFAQSSNAILMQYMGDRQTAAPMLNNVVLEPSEAWAIFDLLLSNVRLWLSHNIIHGDLSAFNILYWDGAVKVIDFPQAIDPRFNANAFSLLTRDIENVYRYLSRYGVRADPFRLAEGLWTQFLNGDL